MSTKDPKEAKEPKELKHRPEALRQPQRKDSFTTVLTYLQGKTLPPRVASTASPVSTTQSAPVSPVQGLSKPRRHSNGVDVKKKARKSSTTLRKFSFSSLAGNQEDRGTKTSHSKAPEGTPSTPTPPKTAKNNSSEKVNKTTQEPPEPKKKSQTELPKSAPETKTPEVKRTPPPMPKSILRVASPDGTRPPPRHIRSYSASAANPDFGQLANATGLCPISPTEPVFPDSNQESGTMSQPTSPILRPLSPGATVRFAKATIHRVDVGPGRRFAPVKRRSKSTVTYIAPLDPVSQNNPPKVHIQSPTKLRRHQENQKAMGRYWQRTEEEEAQWRAEAERRAAEEAERYRAEPASPPTKAAEPQKYPWAARLTALDKLPPLDTVTILLLDKTESEAKSDADDKLETIVASESDDSDAESDGGASTAVDDLDEVINSTVSAVAKDEKLNEDEPREDKLAVREVKAVDREPSSEAGDASTNAQGGVSAQLDQGHGESKQTAGQEVSDDAKVLKESTATPTPTEEVTGKDTAGKETTAKTGTQNQTQTAEVQPTEPLKAKPSDGGAPLGKPAPETAKATPEPAKAPTPPSAPPSKTTDGDSSLLKAETPRAQAAVSTTKKPTSTTITSGIPTPPENPRRYSRQLERSFTPEPYRERSLSRRPSPTLKHKKSMVSLAGAGAGAGGNHLHLSKSQRARRYLGEHDQKHEIAA